MKLKKLLSKNLTTMQWLIALIIVFALVYACFYNLTQP